MRIFSSLAVYAASFVAAAIGAAGSPADLRGQRRGARYRSYSRSRYMPHQGERECARRIRQAMDGQLVVWDISTDPRMVAEQATAKAVPAEVLFENGLDAERRAKNRERALKAARTRAAKRAAELETAANG